MSKTFITGGNMTIDCNWPAIYWFTDCNVPCKRYIVPVMLHKRYIVPVMVDCISRIVRSSQSKGHTQPSGRGYVDGAGSRSFTGHHPASRSHRGQRNLDPPSASLTMMTMMMTMTTLELMKTTVSAHLKWVPRHRLFEQRYFHLKTALMAQLK